MKVTVIEIKHSQLKNIKPYLKGVINDLKNSDAWKI